MKRATTMLKGHARSATLRGVIRHPACRVGAALIVLLWASTMLQASGVPTGFSACTLLTLNEAKGILGPKGSLEYDWKWNTRLHDAAECDYHTPFDIHDESSELRIVSVIMELITKQEFMARVQKQQKEGSEVENIPGFGDVAYYFWRSPLNGGMYFLKGQKAVEIWFSGIPHDSARIMPYAKRALSRLP